MKKSVMLFNQADRRSQAGLSVLELLIALGLGILISTMAGGIFLASRQVYVLNDDAIRLQDSGRTALSVISRSIRLVRRRPQSIAVMPEDDLSMIRGFDHRSLKSTSADIQHPLAASINGSDILALRFANYGANGSDESGAFNCAGFTTDQPTVWSIFYVATDDVGEPALYCKYQGKQAWATAAIVQGVESFQVLYGVGEQSDAAPVRYMTATQIDELDRQAQHAAPEGDAVSPQSYWHLISEIRIALLLRGTQAVRNDGVLMQHDLFGTAYANRYCASDPGTRIDEAMLPTKKQNRLRRLFSTTIRLGQPVQELSE